ncbi:MAG: indole-3-glycerol phosphate synthase TrpC [Microthrixaceae bacterium]
MAGTYLDRIVAFHRARAAADPRSSAEMAERLAIEREGVPARRPFAAALRAADRLSVIAEVKRRSPSKGLLHESLDPVGLATAYRRGGAAALSVLTDEPHFGGSSTDLVAARGAVDLPVLRKDFTVAAVDVYDAALMGADAVLLIVAALRDDELTELSGLAAAVGLEALVETHDEDEVARAVAATGSTVIGVNQRDLFTFEVDRDRAVRVAAAIPEGVVKVAESGVGGPRDAEALAAAGYDAVLVGEHLVTSEDPGQSIARLRVPRR